MLDELYQLNAAGVRKVIQLRGGKPASRTVRLFQFKEGFRVERLTREKRSLTSKHLSSWEVRLASPHDFLASGMYMPG
jgi:hypothetical protein